MKRMYTISFAVAVLALLGIGIFFAWKSKLFDRNYITIAVVGPINGVSKRGNAIWNGVSLCIDEINEQGGIDGRQIKLLAFDDGDDRRLAIQKAEEIAENREINLVLGNNLSSTSIAAGRIYKKKGIPAITASASSVSVTKNNEWFFRVSSNTAFSGKYIANFMAKNLKTKKASILFDKNSVGSSLSRNFESQANNLGIEIVKKWSFDSEKIKTDGNASKLDVEIQKVVSEVLSTQDPGMIFLSMLNSESVKVLKYLRSSGIKHQVFIGDEFSAESFRMFQEFPKERAILGYYSNGVYAVTPFLTDVANKEAKVFIKKYKEKYGVEPSWHAASYYDAALAAVKAIRNAEIVDITKTKLSRLLIKKALQNIDNHEKSIEGVTKRIY
ncbi:MAG: ABC transporter substrate-binding protein, partial [Spirochaetota bacterium]